MQPHLRLWMPWHLARTIKHSSSMEHAPKSRPMSLWSAELTTKARASISFGNSQMLRSSSLGLTPKTCLASWWLWLSWTLWQSWSIWQNIANKRSVTKRQNKICFLFFILPLVRSECYCYTWFWAMSEQGLAVSGPNFGLYQKPWLTQPGLECILRKPDRKHRGTVSQWRPSSGLIWLSSEFSDWIWGYNERKVNFWIMMQIKACYNTVQMIVSTLFWEMWIIIIWPGILWNTINNIILRFNR